MKQRKCIHCGRLRWTRQKAHPEHPNYSVGGCLTCIKRAERKLSTLQAGKKWHGKNVEPVKLTQEGGQA